MTEEFEQSAAEIQKAVNAAAKAGRFMVVVYRVENDERGNGRIVMNRITYEFPSLDLKESVKMLERDLQPAIIAADASGGKPMENAQDVEAPIIDLFGEQSKLESNLQVEQQKPKTPADETNQ